MVFIWSEEKSVYNCRIKCVNALMAQQIQYINSKENSYQTLYKQIINFFCGIFIMHHGPHKPNHRSTISRNSIHCSEHVQHIKKIIYL